MKHANEYLKISQLNSFNERDLKIIEYEISKAIEQSSEKGNTSVVINRLIPNQMLSLLEQKGFYFHKINEESYSISWAGK